MILVVLSAAAAYEVELRVEDVGRAALAPVTAELVGPGGPAALEVHDDGVAPDEVSGDGVYTGVGTIRAPNGKLTVTAGSASWQGGFTLPAASEDGVVRLAVRLEASGLAALVVDAPAGGAGGEAAGAAPGGGRPAASAERSELPEGYGAGWALALGALGLLGWLAWLGGRASVGAGSPEA